MQAMDKEHEINTTVNNDTLTTAFVGETQKSKREVEETVTKAVDGSFEEPQRITVLENQAEQRSDTMATALAIKDATLPASVKTSTAESQPKEAKLTGSDAKESVETSSDVRREGAPDSKELDEKKSKRPSVIELKDKSDLFKQIIDVALAIEKTVEENKKLRAKNKELSEDRKKIQDEKVSLSEQLKDEKKTTSEQATEIQRLQQEVAQRDEVVDIVKADKNESAQEFKNALAAALRMYFVDYCDLKNEPMSEDVGLAFADTLEGIFKVLNKNGIEIQK